MKKTLRGAWRRFGDPLALIPRSVNKLYSVWLTLTYPFLAVGRKLSVSYPCHLTRRFAGNIRIGCFVIIGKDSFIHIVEDDEGAETDIARLIIGDRCTIGARSVISAKNSIIIERDVITGMSILIQDHQHARELSNMSIRDQGVTPGGRIRIEQGCWIGHGAVIVCTEGEVVIGRNSVVGANSVVARSLPPNSVIVGNPGIPLRFATRPNDPANQKAIDAPGDSLSAKKSTEDVLSSVVAR
jgi:acetyltransferase-like isoleucine patch superfamily enzyme